MIEHIILFGISTLFWSNLFSEFKEFNDIKTYDNYKLIRDYNWTVDKERR